MGAAFFYHLTQRPLEATLPMLLEKARGAGWRVAVRGTDEGRLDWLDERLWQGADDSFLPHGRAGGPHDALQPVLLTSGAAGNDPQCLMTVDGAEVSPEEVGALERVCVLFDGKSGHHRSNLTNSLHELRSECHGWAALAPKPGPGAGKLE